jgi:hypothetical protein
MTARLGTPWITCVNTVFWILGCAFIPHISHVWRLLLVLPRPSRRCHSSWVPGILFTVQASHERQVVIANQQALTAAVRRYCADYKKALTNLAAQLRTS